MNRSPVRLLLAGLLSLFVSSAVRQHSAAAQEQGVRIPSEGVSIGIQFGLKDKRTSVWDGEISLSHGSVVAMEVLPRQTGRAADGAWQLRTVPRAKPARKSVHDPKVARLVHPLLTVTVDAPMTATATVTTQNGNFAFVLSDLLTSRSLAALQGQVRVEASPMSFRLTDGPDDEDWPAAFRASDGSIWMTCTAYTHASKLDAATIHQERKFDDLRPTGHGDQLRLARFDGKRWGEPIPLGKRGLDLWNPAIVVDHDGTVWVVCSQNIAGNWDLYATAYQPESRLVIRRIRLTCDPGADVHPVVLAHPDRGRKYVVWQGWRDGNFDILLKPIDGNQQVAASPEKSLFDSSANEWGPAAAFDSQGRLSVAFDTYQAGNYDVKLVADATGERPAVIDVAATPLFEARPSIAMHRNDRVWVAYEQAGQNWGKDTGMRWRGPSGEQLYWAREIQLRCVDGDRVMQAAGLVPCEPITRNYPDAKTRRMSGPRLTVDGQGRLWLFYRRHPNNTGGGEIWSSWVTYHTGPGWAEPVRMAHSENLMDNRPAVIPVENGGALVIHSTDGRTNNTASAQQNDLFCTRVLAADGVATPELVDLPPSPRPAPVVHQNENEDVRRIRNYRTTVGGKTYQLLRGEFHRHTELTAHRDMDGTLQDMFRYGLDAAQMDWIGNGDHDNGNGIEYLWWMVQKRTDIYHHAPHFLPMFTYERSVTYPSGHRNAMFASRGVRPLPRIPGGKGPLYGTPEEGSPDIKTFYAYLKHFGGICASHTSGTNMGTDWRDNDPEVEPIVEIYQGLRHSYEHDGAPATAVGAQDAIGGYRPAGFVWNALMKGHRLGFQSSSDHYSAHISYAVVWSEEPSRQAILEAFQRRHCYAANDNIVLDVRCGEQMMGDVFTLDKKPTLDIAVIGTKPIERLSVIRGVGNQAPEYVYDGKFSQREVKLNWCDEDAQRGATSYYYVRVEQSTSGGGYGALAWSSPMWITYEK